LSRTTLIYTLSLHDALPIYVLRTRETVVVNEDMVQAMAKYGSSVIPGTQGEKSAVFVPMVAGDQARGLICLFDMEREHAFSDSEDRKSTRLNSSHRTISYAV